MLVIDNNSKDDTFNVCDKFLPVSKFKFKYIFEPKQGLSNARNRGIKESSGDILIFTDDDVSVTDCWLSEYDSIYINMSPDCVFGKIIPDWNGRKPEWLDKSLEVVFGFLDYGDKCFVVENYNYEFFGANFSIRRDILLEIGGFDPKLGRTSDKLFIGEETLVFRWLMNNKKNIIYTPKSVVYHYIEEKSKTKEYLKKRHLDIASSIVSMSDHGKPRKFLGMPYFILRELIVFYCKFLPRFAYYYIVSEKTKLFSLQLKKIRNNTMILIYIQRLFKKDIKIDI